MNELDRTIMNLREVARDSHDEGAQDVAVDAVAVLIDLKDTRRFDIATHLMGDVIRGIGCCFNDQAGYNEHARQALFAADALLAALDKGEQ